MRYCLNDTIEFYVNDKLNILIGEIIASILGSGRERDLTINELERLIVKQVYKEVNKRIENNGSN